MNLKDQRETKNYQFDDPVANEIRANPWVQQFYPNSESHGRPFMADQGTNVDTKEGQHFLLKMLFNRIMNTKYSVEQ